MSEKQTTIIEVNGVKLEVKDGDLRVLYVKRPPEAPYQFRP